MSHKQVDTYNGNYIDIFLWFWNYLWFLLDAPKFHVVKDHLTDFFQMWYAIGLYNENFTESDHVKGNAEAQIFGGLRDT